MNCGFEHTDTLRGSVATGVQIAGQSRIPGLLGDVRSAFVGAMDATLWVWGGVTARAAVLAVLFLRPDRVRTTGGPADQPGQVVEVS